MKYMKTNSIQGR